MTRRVNWLSLDDVCSRHDLDGAARERIAGYLRLLMKWAPRINLTGAKTERELVNLHIADCLQILSHLPARGTVVDVGAGAGLPSAILSCVIPERRVHAVEPTQKKIAFLNTVKRELSLDGFTPHATRVENLDAELLPFDIAVSRATWALPEWFATARTIVRNGGLIIGMEGSEKYELPPGAERHPYELLDRQRAIIALPT